MVAGRAIPDQFLENRSAFDCALEFATQDNCRGIVGIETKYHEHAKKESIPDSQKLRRYRSVAQNSKVFKPGAIDKIIGTHLQQIWQDHLLVLSMLQHPSKTWGWVKFVLVHPEKNSSFADAAKKYTDHLADDRTFTVRTIESALSAGILPDKIERKFRNRYLW